MPLAKRFEELEVWQAAQNLAVQLYPFFGPDSPAVRDFAFVNQIRAAVVSISNNIAEGFECSSSREFDRFLVIAKRSCGETRSMLWLAPRLGYLPADRAAGLRETAEVLSKRIAALIRSVRG
ncbi:MAG TPA: four helix bundle protein [Opitutaceae bacterium]|nr:four helix bundle protein [Opitutaceae bacterium]